ncbi:hypothetical protein Pelo_3474 [Pelomyxa schiedti]|nr:hypothetical protein Pelo_3474 [Pelomyxa schiedti]
MEEGNKAVVEWVMGTYGLKKIFSGVDDGGLNFCIFRCEGKGSNVGKMVGGEFLDCGGRNEMGKRGILEGHCACGMTCDIELAKWLDHEAYEYGRVFCNIMKASR